MSARSTDSPDSFSDGCAPSTRRALLAGMMLAPTIVAAPALAVSPSSTWAAAMKCFNEALAAETAYDRSIWSPAYHVQENGGREISAHVHAEYDRLLDARCEAEETLILTPAQHLSGVIWKIDYARQRWEEFTDWPEDWWDAIMGDLQRFAAMGGALTLQRAL